jgi:hypothetical protein
MNAIDAIAVEVIALPEQAKEKMEGVRGLKFDGTEDPTFDGRAVSIAITHLETAQLWFANARR